MKRVPLILLVALLAGLGIYYVGDFSAGSENRLEQRADLFAVRPGNLRIEVTEDGELEAATSVKVRSQIEGRNTIEWLIPEGANVKEGDELVVLDVTGFKDREETQAISLSRARSELVSAETGYEIQESQNASDIDKATTKLFFAQLDFEKFTGQTLAGAERTVDEILSQWSAQAERELIEMERAARKVVEPADATEPANRTEDQAGAALPEEQHVAPPVQTSQPVPVVGHAAESEEPTGTLTNEQQENSEPRAMSEGQQRLDQTLSDISLKQEALSQAEEKLAWTRRLYAKKYVPEQDLKRDEFAVDKARYDLEVAKSKLRLLITYDLRKEIRDFESKVEEAADELERTKLRCRAQLESKKSDWDAKKQQYDIELGKLEKLRENIEGGTIKSPSAGLVVYGKSGNWRRQEPIDVGTEVQRGQTILILPDTSTMIARLNIPEAQRELIAPGQAATLTVESQPGVPYSGYVTYIGQTADTQSSWLNPDVKQYRCTVQLQGDMSSLRPNQSTNVTIEVATLKDVLYVPIQAVQRSGNVHYVWVLEGSRPVARLVEIGQASTKFVELTSGVESGDRVFLHDIDGVERPKFAKENAEIDAQRAKAEAQRMSAAKERRGTMGTDTSDNEGDDRAGSDAEGRGPRPIGASNGPAGQGERPSGRGMAGFTALMEEAKTAFPEYAEQLGDRRKMRSLMRDETFRQKMAEHATIGPKWKALTTRMSPRSGKPSESQGERGEHGGEDGG